MLKRISSLILITLFVWSILLPAYNASGTVYLGNDPTLYYDFELEAIKSEILKRISSVPYIDPALSDNNAYQEALLLLKQDADLEKLASLVISARFTPPFEDLMFAFTVLKPGAGDKLDEVDGLLLALPDARVDFPGDLDDKLWELREKFASGEITIRELPRILRELKQDKLNHPDTKSKDIFGLGLDGVGDGINTPSPDMYYVTDLLGLNKPIDGTPLFNLYNGSNVTIAVVDTGVDYGTLGLFSWPGKVSRDIYGRTSAFDADNQVIGFTNITVEAYSNATGVFINSTGADPLVWLGVFFPFAIPYSWLTGTTFPVDMNVTGILNPGDTAKFGVVFMWIYGLDLIPLLVIDSDADGVYDTVYADVSSAYKEAWFIPPDWSFADEQALTVDGLTVPTYDDNGDGIPDYQIGSLAWGIDIFCSAPPASGDTCSILEPIDDQGEYVVFVYDWHGHGTSVASVAGGVADFIGNFYPEITFGTIQPYGSGIAPNVSIMGIPIFTMFDVFEAWYWASGFDLIPGTEGNYSVPGFRTVYGNWTYTGVHKADIISNSWGFVGWEHASAGWFIYGPFVVTLFAEILSIPGYLDPNYPGTLFVISAGNEGPGAGTTGPPGYSGFVITAAASTTFPWINSIGYGGGYNDTIVYFSSRGPNVAGYPVPELSAPGAFGFAPTAIWLNLFTGGDGAFLDLFGGTSMAAPVISGSAAVVIHAYKDIYGYTPRPDEVKRLLLMSAKDMGLPPNIQGTGRVDVYKAINYLLNGVAPGVGIDTYSLDTATNYVLREFIPFFTHWIFSSIFVNNIFDDPFSLLILVADGAWREYPVYGWAPQGLTEFGQPVIAIDNPLPSDLTFNVEVVTDMLVHVDRSSAKITSVMGPWFFDRSALFIVVPWPGDYDFIRAQISMSWETFDNDFDGFDDVNLYLYAFDWVDDGDNIPQPSELSWIAISPLWGTTQEVLIPKSIVDNLNGKLLLAVRETWNLYGIDPFITLDVEYWKRVPHPWITPTTTSIGLFPFSTRYVYLDFNVPLDEPPSVVQGYIILRETTLNREVIIPFSYEIFMVVSPMSGLIREVDFKPYNESFYNPNFIRGLFDFDTEDAGDHRLWFFRYLGDPEERTFGIYAYAEWESPFTDIDMFSIGPDFFVVDKSLDTWNGYSTIHQTRLTPTSEVVAVWPIQFLYLYGRETISMWNRLYDGVSPAGRVWSSVRFARLNFGNGSAFDISTVDSRVVSGGILLTIPVRIETGIDLANVSFFNQTSDPGINFRVTPSITSAKAFSPDNIVTFEIFVPQSTLDTVSIFGPQTFNFNVTVWADYLPYTTLFEFQITIRPFPLPLKTTVGTGDGVLFLDIGSLTGEVTIIPYYGYDPSTGSFGSSIGQQITYPVVVTKVIATPQWGYVEVLIQFRYNDGTTAWLPGQMWIFRDSGEIFLTGAFLLLP